MEMISINISLGFAGTIIANSSADVLPSSQPNQANNLLTDSDQKRIA